MRPGGGKNKGSRFEIQICRKLSKWITGTEKPEIFWRSAASGAKATTDRKKNQKTKMHGDIMSIDPEGEWFTKFFFVECKYYKDLRFEDMINKTGALWGFWKKCSKEADEAGLVPLLIFKRNNAKIFMMTDINIPAFEDYIGPITLPKIILSQLKGAPIWIVDFERFTSHYDAETIEMTIRDMEG